MAEEASGSHSLSAHDILGRISRDSGFAFSRRQDVMQWARDRSSSITGPAAGSVSPSGLSGLVRRGARVEAKELRRQIDRGEDPAQERKSLRDAPTVRGLADRYRREHLPRRPRIQVNDWAMVENEILSRAAGKVADVHDGDIEAFHRRSRSAAGPSARIGSGGRVEDARSPSNRQEGEDAPWRNQAQGNPCKGVARNQEEGHERFFSPAELAALGDALQA